MKEILLTKGLVAIVDDCHYETLNLYTWQASGMDGKQYAYNSTLGYMHRFLMPHAKMVDHVNRDGLDNRVCNLRKATKSQNGMNSKVRKSRSGLRGAYYFARNKKNPWFSQIKANGKLYRVGVFKTAELAHAAYLQAAKRLHGEFACTLSSTER